MNNWQQDPNLKNIPLGDGSTTIGASGCTVSAIGDAINVTADIVNKFLQMIGGFQGALVIWAKIAVAFPGITAYRYWTYNNDDVLAQLAKGNRVIVEVPAAPIGGTGSHWVEYIGNGQLKDPWTGHIRPTSDFPNPTGYCVISGKWQATENPVPSTQGGGSVDQNTINGKKAYLFDLIWIHKFGKINTNNATEQQVTDFLAWLDSNVNRAGWYDKVCIALNLTGDTNKIDYTQVLNKIEDPEAVQKYAEIVAIVNK